MQCERIKAFIIQKSCKGNAKSKFISQCMGKMTKIEEAYGESIDDLVATDESMLKALRDLEWKVGKDDLDNYQKRFSQLLRDGAWSRISDLCFME